MAEDKISQTTLKTLVEADAIHSASVVGEASGFYIAVKYGETEKVLTARAGNVRFFRSMDTVVDYLLRIIICHFDIESTNANGFAQIINDCIHGTKETYISSPGS